MPNRKKTKQMMCILAADWLELSLEVAGHNRIEENTISAFIAALFLHQLYIFQC